MIWIILAFGAHFICCWIRIRIQEANLMRIHADPDTDPDPKHWLTCRSSFQHLSTFVDPPQLYFRARWLVLSFKTDNSYFWSKIFSFFYQESVYGKLTPWAAWWRKARPTLFAFCCRPMAPIKDNRIRSRRCHPRQRQPTHRKHPLVRQMNPLNQTATTPHNHLLRSRQKILIRKMVPNHSQKRYTSIV
jgi:hypothetical protein